MNRFFTHKTEAASLLRGLLLLSIMMLSAAGNARAQDAGTTVDVATAEELKEALTASTATTISVTEGIELSIPETSLQLGASHTLTINEGKAVTITQSDSQGGGIKIVENTLTINGTGTLVCAQESGPALFGNISGTLILENITVNITSGQGFNVQALTVENGGTIDIKSFSDTGINLSGILTIKEGGIIEVGAGNGRNRGISVSKGGQFILEDGGTLTGSDGGTIYLEEGSKVTGMSGKFSDQENELNDENKEVTVSNENTSASPTGLTKGYYVWNSSLFAKAKPQDEWKLEDGILTISNNAGMQNWIRYKDTYSQIRTDVTSVTISGGVTNIVDQAFLQCGYLASVSIPSSVTSIGDNAFGFTEKLTAITIPSQVKNIGNQTFFGSALTSVTFEGEDPPTIAADAFSGCNSLNDIFVPTKAIEKYKTAIEKALGADWVDKVKPDNGWTISSDGASLTITSDDGMQHWLLNGKRTQSGTITSLTLGGKVTTIKNNHFSQCPQLATVTLNEGLTAIGGSAFEGCTALTSLHLPASLTELGTGNIKASAFYYSSIAELTIADGNKYFKAVNGMLLDNTGTTLICCPPGKKDNFVIPAGVTMIDTAAFHGNEHLTAITLPESLTEIGEYAFSSCTYLRAVFTGQKLTTIMDRAFADCTTLTSITLPAKLTTLGNAFTNCTSLNTVTFKSNLPEMLSPYLFAGCAALTDIFVPAGQVDAYKNALKEQTGADKVKASPEIASIQSDKLTSFALKGKAGTAENVIDSLNARYPGVSATLTNGEAIELPLTWMFKESEQGSKEFSSASQAENTFTWTADKGSYPLSGELADADLTGEITVTNPTVITDKEVITLSPNETLIGDGSTTAESVTLTGDATFENVQTGQTIVASGTTSSITLSGIGNNLGAINNQGTLTLTAEPGTSIEVGTITNSSIFTDETGSVKQVIGSASINLTTPGAEPSNQSGTGQVTLTTNPTNIPSDASVTYTWQRQYNGSWTDIGNPYLRSTSITGSNVFRTDITGTYRCRITVAASNSTANTTLLTAAATATVQTLPPPPEPVYYNVTLPAVEGVVTDPAAGKHAVEEWTDFRFTLQLDEAYNQSVPVVTTDRGDELTPRLSDGAYTVSVRNDDVAITISGVVKNPDPVANAELHTGSTITARDGLLLITTDRPTEAQVIALTGQLIRSLALPSGTTRIDGLADGIYIVRLSDGTVQKVIVRK